MMEKIKAGEITGQTGDYMLRATAANGQIRAFAATSRDLVEKARQAHNTSPVATAALGRLMTAGVMMGSMMKADSDLLTIRVEGDGPIGGLTVTADKNGNVKGYAFHPEVMLPPNAKGKLDVGGALGVGVLSVIQDIGLKEPYVGQTILVTGEIAEDLTYYYATSEQTPSSVALGVLMNKENTVRQAGGFIVQLLPGAEEATIAALEKTIGELELVTTMLNKGMTPEDELLIRSIPLALSTTERVCSSVNLGSTKTGINMDAVKLMGEMVRETAEYTKEDDSLGCAKLVVFCNAPDDNPFMAGAFHGVTEADKIINVGVSGPGVVKTALEKVRGENFEVLCETIKKTAFKVTRVGQLVAQEASRMLNVPFGIVDLSLAPTPAIGDSVADILCEIGLEHAGAPGTTAALALLNDQVKKGGVMASSYVGGLSGAFIPVSEDQGMIDAVNAGALTIEKLEAMTCVCSVGLDMIAIPGDTKATTISGIIADEMAIGMVNQKTTAVRIIPVIGKGVGETVEFGGLLGYAPIMPVNTFSCDAFVNRGGRIPAPIHSFKN